RSYFILGEQLAYCQRNVAIYTTMALCGLVWARFGRNLPRLTWWGFSLLVLPMALDGFTQLLGLRESTWQHRTITGCLFGLACPWFGFPLLDRSARMLRILMRASVRPRPLA